MFRTLKTTLVAGFLAGSLCHSSAFSLIGDFDTWQTTELGYQRGGDVGGPQNLGEEYRWNIRSIVFGFNESFLNYFGSNGVAAVEQAVKILNDLPPVSSLSSDLSEFPLDSRRENYQAGALGLFDLKSFALTFMLEELGLADPERYTWTLRNRVVINNVPFYTVIQRNFDPVTLRPSAYVNGVLLTYQIFEGPLGVWEPFEFAVDPSAIWPTAVAAAGSGGSFPSINTGLFYTGLTRDDVGGLRYMYNPNNFNVENLATNATIISSAALGGSAGAPWNPVFFTNLIGTNITLITNVVVTPPPQLRPGVDKFTFQRADFDSLLGQFFVSTVRSLDTFITNRITFVQGIERVLISPDILFDAADIGVNAVGVPLVLARTAAYINNDALNGDTVSVPINGPGEIQPPVVITFQKLGPHLINLFETSQELGFPGWIWGSFDGTTNAPVVYPEGTTIRDIERQVLGR